MSSHLTCQPNFIPPVNLEAHSRGKNTSYQIIKEGWVPGIYTNQEAADEQIVGYSKYSRTSARMHQAALSIWADHCRANHGQPCPNAPLPSVIWGIKGVKRIFNTRADALEHADEVGMMDIHLMGGDVEVVKAFVKV